MNRFACMTARVLVAPAVVVLVRSGVKWLETANGVKPTTLLLGARGSGINRNSISWHPAAE